MKAKAEAFIFAKVDVELRDHERAHKAGSAMGTWLWAMLWTRAKERDGFVSADALKGAWAGARQAKADMKRLVECELAEVSDEGWRLKGYARRNETKAEIEERRRDSRERKSKSRGEKGGVTRDSHGGHTPEGRVTDTFVTAPESEQNRDRDRDRDREDQETQIDPAPAPRAGSDDGLDALDAAIAEMGQARVRPPAPLPAPLFDLTPPPGPKSKARPRVTGEQQPAPTGERRKSGPSPTERLYVAAWERGITAAVGRVVAYRAEWPIVQDLIAIARAHLPGARGDDVTDGLQRLASEYAKLHDGNQFHPGLLPKHALRWLNDGKRPPTAPAPKPQGGGIQPGNHLNFNDAPVGAPTRMERQTR